MSKTNELAIKDSEVLAMFQADAQMGLEDAGDAGSTPMLVMLSSQSSAIKEDEKDAEGNDLKIGNFFHTGTRLQYASPEVNILYIKEAYLPKFQKPDETALNYVIGGIIRDETKAPFIMYIKGMSLSSFFEFKADIARVTGNKQQPIPLYALIVKMTKDVKESKGFGKVNTVKVAILRSDSGFPMVETDKDTIMWLKDGYARVKSSINSLVEKRDEDETVQENVIEGEISTEEAEDIADKMPF